MENSAAGVSRHMVNLWLDMAEMMLACNAEIYRIEDTLTRIGRACGAKRMEVFAITSSIVVTAEGSGWQYTCTRRLRNPSSSDFSRLEDLNALARRFCARPMSEDELERELDIIGGKNPRSPEIMAGSVLAAFAFTLFFGGSFPDAAVSGAFGLAVSIMLDIFSRININRFAAYFLSSVSSGSLICLLARLFPALRPDMIIAGVIMITIPGISTTNSIRDMLTGDTLSGTLRLIQSLLEAVVLAGSFMFAVWITGSGVAYQNMADGLYQILPAVGGCVGFAMLFNCRAKYLLAAIPGGALCWGIYLLCEIRFGLGLFACAMISAAVMSLLAEICARVFKAPATLFLIPFIVPLIPGCSLFYSFSSMLVVTTSKYGAATAHTVLGIAVGTGLIATLFSLKRKV